MKQQTKTPDSKEGLHTQGDIVYHKHWGKCEIVKAIDQNGYVVQSDKKPIGEYLNVDKWDFIEENIYSQTLFIDKIIKEGERLGYGSTNLGIFINGALFSKDLALNERQALLDLVKECNSVLTKCEYWIDGSKHIQQEIALLKLKIKKINNETDNH